MGYIIVIIIAAVAAVYFYKNNKAKVDPTLDKAAEVVKEVKEKL